MTCQGCVVLPGFWNTHVHFTEPKWNDAAHLSVEQLHPAAAADAYAFTTVVDLGSDPGNTIALRRAPDTGGGVDHALITQLITHHMAMVPRLKLFSGDSDIARIRYIIATFHQLGGELMFGTDTGFLTDYDMTEEYRHLYLAVLTYRDVLTMLTIAPAQRFCVADDEGRIAPGLNGDVTILSSDPVIGEASALTRVGYTIPKGRVLYQSN